ncbi:MAG: type II toxin-antitoxin system Phd/YefM family antitoxin [Proteobacteria bacterium]|nr:type II toxin-antitoxin system Phd/YefM family antitoxin [Pseudomonadota bacterium]
MNVVKFSVAKNQLKELLDQVEDDQDYTIISRHGAGDAVVMSMGYFTSLMETIYLLKSPANSAHLDKSIRQHQSGETISQKLAVD